VLASGMGVNSSIMENYNSLKFIGKVIVHKNDIFFIRKQTFHNRVFGVMSMCIFTVCRSMTMVPDYAKGKTGALRIMKLYERQSKIDPNDQSGIILVRVFHYDFFN
jgi:hypothetical protein